MIEVKPCPKCGKPMREQPKFRGLWTCPDYQHAINDAPPFQYKCTGMELTPEGQSALQDEIFKIQIKRN